jgi:hypothetical protein
MEWWHVLIAIPVFFLGVFIHIKIIKYKRDYFKNGGWRDREK